MTSVENAAYKGDENLIERYQSVRQKSIDICQPLEVEDMVVQPIAFVSPPKWHLAHTTWFFVNFLLHRFGIAYAWPEEYYPHLFNSYYKSQGKHWEQGSRGDLSRPTVNQILKFREDVDNEMITWLTSYQGDMPNDVKHILRLGLEHEQQHQELLLMDIKYILSCNPGSPAYMPAGISHNYTSGTAFLRDNKSYWSCEGGLEQFGLNPSEQSFCFDNETPNHKAYLQAYKIAHCTVSNGEFAEFIADGAYQEPSLWLSEGWDYINNNAITAPLYWSSIDGEWFEYTLSGMSELRVDVPVAHISFHEAYAFARWAKKRLPTEFEWEHFAKHSPANGSITETSKTDLFLESNTAFAYHPSNQKEFVNVHGGLWEWTSSPYSPYPGYQSRRDAFGEYNGKFMINQVVLRGGCIATPRQHYRTSYRNFFQTTMRWPFTGLRLAEDD